MLRTILTYLWDRRTTVLGYAVSILGVLATSNKFTQDTTEWLILGIGVLNVFLGHYNNAVIKRQAAAGPVDKQAGFVRVGLMLILLGAVAMFLSACGVLPAARSYDQKVAGAYATLAVVNDTAAVLRNANVISLADAIEVRAKTREALTVVDMAAVLSPAEGGSEVARALDLLKQAQDLMCAKRPNEPNCQYLLQRTQL